MLISPALRTLFGRLPRGAGDAAPPVVVDPGRLSPTRLFIRDSISRRLSALPGVGDMSCSRAWLACAPRSFRPRTHLTRAAHALAPHGRLAGPELSLPLQLGELRFFGEDFIAALLHSVVCSGPSPATNLGKYGFARGQYQC